MNQEMISCSRLDYWQENTIKDIGTTTIIQ